MAKQFYETYRGDEKVAPLLRQLPWTHHLMILGRSRYPEEREFYMGMAIQERWRSRELDRQIKAALFERAVLHPAKLSTVLREVYPQAVECFKDSYRHFQTQEKKGRREIMSHRFSTPQPKILAPKHLLLCQKDSEGLRAGCHSRESGNPRRSSRKTGCPPEPVLS